MRAAVGVAVLALYLAGGTLAALAARRRSRVRGAGDYFVAGYRLSGFLSAMTYAATTYSAFMIVGLVGFAYHTGVASLGFELAYFTATMMLIALYAPRVWRLARRYRWVSPGEMLSSLYGSRLVGALTAILYLYALVPYMAAQVKGVAEAVAGLAGGESYALGVVLAVVVMAAWTLLAGVWSVAVTDALQGLWMLSSSLALLAWLLHKVATDIGLGEATRLLAGEGLLGVTGFWTPTVFVGFTLPWIFFAATNPQAVQRLYMPRDEKALYSMAKWFSVFGLAYTAIVVAVGLLARSMTLAGLLPNIESKDAVTPTLLAHAPTLLAAVVFTSIVAAAVSTADSIALTVASSVARDLYRGRSEVRVGALVVVAMSAAAAALAAARISFIVALSVLSSLILLSTAPATLLAWTSPGRARGAWRNAVASIALGAAVATLAALHYGARALAKTVLSLPVPVWVLAASTAPLLPLLLPTASGRHGGGAEEEEGER